MVEPSTFNAGVPDTTCIDRETSIQAEVAKLESRQEWINPFGKKTGFFGLLAGSLKLCTALLNGSAGKLMMHHQNETQSEIVEGIYTQLSYFALYYTIFGVLGLESSMFVEDAMAFGWVGAAATCCGHLLAR